jgi:hypothetical protein
MPSISNITVKKADGTTDVTFVAKVPSAGDSSPAVWRQDSHAAPYVGLKPELRMDSRFNGDRTARRVNLTLVYKTFFTDTTTGVASEQARAMMTASAVIPVMAPQADIDELVAQFGNLLYSTLVRDCFKQTYSPT